MSYSSDDEDDTCKHTMGDCCCYEYDMEVIISDKCWNCNESIKGHPYRLPKIHGGWIAYFYIFLLQKYH